VISFNTSREVPPYVSVDLCLLTSQYCVIILGFHSHLGIRDSVVGIATHYRLDGPGIEYRWGAMFSAPVQTVTEARPASYTMGTGSSPAVKRLGRGVDHPPPCTAEVKIRVELYLYSASGPLWPVLG
jgi:hypothetical protein